MSVYHFGTKWPWIDNVLPIPDQFHTFFTNRSDFYTDYAVKLNKPMMIAETAAAFHTNSTISVGPGELAIKQAWWRQFLTNATYLNLYPKIKLYSIFEIVKHEGVTHRDFAITLKPNILQAFKTDFQQVEGFFVEANSTTSQNAGLTGEVVDYSKSGASCTSPMMSILMSMIYFMIL
ncbi:hypothetical protein BC833DRAFT_122922 [Globomyces pollinis-pini]|nr:hypothetical protein BC833DRAFT_122922 [Globomyces pollinis-pini]